jgi:fumarate reductase flavoprotein subunit
MKENGTPELSRRGFLGGSLIAGIGLAGAGLAGCSSAPSAGGDAGAELPTSWDREADVVVLGGGAAGLSAAMAAAKEGASVIVLEKAEVTGGTTALSAGVIHAADTPFQKEFTEYQSDTTDLFEQWLLTVGEGMVDEKLVADYAAHAKEHITELVELGAEVSGVYGPAPVPYVPEEIFAKRIHEFGYKDLTGGGAVAQCLLDGATAAGVTIELSCTARSLIKAADKGIVGVVAETGGSTINVKANRGVVVATSGYDWDVDMARNFSPEMHYVLTHSPEAGMLASAPTNTGDGIKMGLEVGADLAGFGAALDMTFTVMSSAMGTNGLCPNIIIVNGAGTRFVREDCTYGYLTRAFYYQEASLQHPTYTITDADGILANVFGQTVEEAVAAGSWLVGETPEELALAIGVPPAALKATIEGWNADLTATGADSSFGKQGVVAPLSKAPYYATRNTYFSLGPAGGLKINVNAEVLDVHGEVIPRLFAGGLASGGWIGPYYPSSGIAIMGGLHWGRKAGSSAAALEAWV